VGVAGANATTFAHLNLNSSTLHFYRVRAYEGPNNSAYSNVASAVTQATPAAPSNLVATTFSSSQINLTWTDNAVNETGFKLERSTDGVTFTQTSTLPKNATTFSATGLAPSTSYQFRLRAYDGPNHSPYSNTASSATQAPPAAPANLVATPIASSKIKLTWTDNATNETGFKLERSTDGVNFSLVASAAANATSFTATNLTATSTYHFRLRAYDGANYSAYTNVASATTLATPAAPSNLTATPSAGRITLRWTDNGTYEDGFKLERSVDGINFTQFGVLGPNWTTYPHAGLASGTTYYYRVRTFDGPNHSSYSNIASATVP
jgi:hypothetical protein